MRTSVSYAASLCLVTLTSVVPAQAGSLYGCHDECTPTTMSTLVTSGTHDVPFPTRIGRFISHFDSVGVPQSIVTPEGSHLVVTEIPCPPVVKNGFFWSFYDN